MRRVASTVARRLAGVALAVAAPRAGPQPTMDVLSRRTFSTTAALHFSVRKHEMEKRRLRELERAGIDPNDDDNEPWIAPEEQQRLVEEEEARQAEEEERRKEFLAKRAEEDTAKRQKFKEFRAKQIAMSRSRKEAAKEQRAAAGGEAEEAGEGSAAERLKHRSQLLRSRRSKATPAAPAAANHRQPRCVGYRVVSFMRGEGCTQTHTRTCTAFHLSNDPKCCT